MSNYMLSRKQHSGDGCRRWMRGMVPVRAAELRASAQKETRRDLAEEFEDLARAYLLLAEMAERNGQLDYILRRRSKRVRTTSTPRRR